MQNGRASRTPHRPCRLRQAGTRRRKRRRCAVSLRRLRPFPAQDFLGPGPWLVLRWLRNYVPTPDADPIYLYTDDLVALVPERRVSNGQPSLHAHLSIGPLPAAGEHVVHVGTGTGYYTAILAHLVGPSGRVTRIEYDASLAARAGPTLRPMRTSQ